MHYLNLALPEVDCKANTVIETHNKYGAPATVSSTGGRYFWLVVDGSIPASMEVSIMNAAWDQVASMENAAPTAIYSLIQNEGECWFGTAFWQGKPAALLSVSSWATTE